jgi:hypothetical protein
MKEKSDLDYGQAIQKTIEIYSNISKEYLERTQNIDLGLSHKRFVSYLNQQGHFFPRILDMGCALEEIQEYL